MIVRPQRGRRRLRALARAAALIACSAPAACSGATSLPSTTAPAVPPAPARVASPDAAGVVWLCAPGLRSDPCAGDLSATAIAADGARTVQHARSASRAPFDCFYIYPTVSMQPTGNANLHIDPEETSVAIAQAARFSEDCTLYAPVYRQLTIANLLGRATTHPDAAEAYGDVLGAWKDYLANYNHGRGVVLIGHSQGAFMLKTLIQAEIDPRPAQRRLLVSAILLGGNVLVPIGKPVGGDFAHVPACSSATQTACIVAYSSFNTSPPQGSLFGRSSKPGDEVLCVNPAALADGLGNGAPAVLSPYLPAKIAGLVGAAGGRAPAVTTPWITYPDLFTGRCEDSGGANSLQIDDVRGAGDHRPHLRETLGPAWGLHLVDVNVALGDLVRLVADQGRSWLERR